MAQDTADRGSGMSRGEIVKRLYGAYCRSCTRASCSPGAIGLALAVIVLGVAGGASRVRGHTAGIVHAGWIAAAAVMTAGACLLLVVAARIVAGAAGQHTEIVPLPEPQARPDPVPAAPAPAGTIPAPAGTPGSYTWKVQAAEMAAAADALADDDTGVVVSQAGDIYELAGAEEES